MMKTKSRPFNKRMYYSFVGRLLQPLFSGCVMLLLPHILHQSGETGSSDDDALVWYMCLLPSQERGERTTIKKTQQFHSGFVVLFDHLGALDGGVFEKTMVPANIALAMLKGMVADGVYLEGLSEYSTVPNLRSFCSIVHRCCQLVLGRGGRGRIGISQYTTVHQEVMQDYNTDASPVKLANLICNERVAWTAISQRAGSGSLDTTMLCPRVREEIVKRWEDSPDYADTYEPDLEKHWPLTPTVHQFDFGVGSIPRPFSLIVIAHGFTYRFYSALWYAIGKTAVVPGLAGRADSLVFFKAVGERTRMVSDKTYFATGSGSGVVNLYPSSDEPLTDVDSCILEVVNRLLTLVYDSLQNALDDLPGGTGKRVRRFMVNGSNSGYSWHTDFNAQKSGYEGSW